MYDTLYPQSVLKKLVLVDLQRVFFYMKEREQEFIRTTVQVRGQTAKKALAQQRKEPDKSEHQIDERNLLFRKFYEDIPRGRLSNEQFALLISD